MACLMAAVNGESSIRDRARPDSTYPGRILALKEQGKDDSP
jgi:hypothetical protein